MKTVSICITMQEDVVDGIEAARGRIPRSRYINDIVRDALRGEFGDAAPTRMNNPDANARITHV